MEHLLQGLYGVDINKYIKTKSQCANMCLLVTAKDGHMAHIVLWHHILIKIKYHFQHVSNSHKQRMFSALSSPHTI